MPTFNQTALNFREWRAQDYEGIRRLWRDDAAWCDLTPEMWRQWYVDIPNGPALIIVGEDADGQILAQAAMTPCRVLVDGVEYAGAHLAAPITSRQLHSFTIPNQNHPAVGLLTACNQLAAERGIAMLFGLPRPGWLHLLKLAPAVGLPRFPGTTFRCLEVSLNDPPPPRPERVVAEPITTFDDAFHELWETAWRDLPIDCGVVRDPAHLNYRNGGHLCLAMRDASDGRLVGYVAVRQDGQLVDMLPRNRSWTRDMLAATWRYLACEASEGQRAQMRTFRVMHTPMIGEAVGDLPFRGNSYRFGFTCRAIDESLASRVVPKRWYVTPNG